MRRTYLDSVINGIEYHRNICGSKTQPFEFSERVRLGATRLMTPEVGIG